jgi:hypothetical protein
VKGQPLDFKSKGFLTAIYKDQTRHLVIRKAVQVGISELLVVDALSLADLGLRIFYVLPTEKLRNEFVRDRVNRPLAMVPYYRNRSRPPEKLPGVVEIDSVGLKSFGTNGAMLFVGSNSPVSFIAFSADVAIVDELDKCSAKNLALVPDRLAASEYKLIREVSTPTTEDFGIDERYKESDQKRWLIRCEHCGTWQEPDFFVNVVREVHDREYELIDREWTPQSGRDIHFFCRKCAKPTNRLAPGEWVAQNRQSNISGYAISQLFSHLTLAELYETFLKALTNESRLQRFYNSVLGQAYTATGTKLTLAILQQCVKAGFNYNLPSRADYSTMGVDVGQPLLHVWISDHPEGRRRLVFAGTVREFEELHSLIARYGVQVAAVDAYPETRKAREFQQKANCPVFLCEYPSSPQNDELNIDYEDKYIKVDRTQSLDAVVADFVTRTILLPANASTLDEGQLFAHLCAPTRVLDPETQRYTWVIGSKPDHYIHAANYDRIASRFFSEPQETDPAMLPTGQPHTALKERIRRFRGR